MKQALAAGKVVNGRITVMTADGKGYSRPIHREEKPVIQVVREEVRKDGGDGGEPPIEQVDVDVMPWLKEYFDKKRVDYIPPRKQPKKSIFRSIVNYIVEEMIP